MRWLAFGGTKLEIRYQSGTWDIPHDLLWSEEDLLEDGTLAYGCGSWDDTLVLMVRQIQKDHVGRNKAYTLLLAPPQEIWESAGWNAACLAWHLFERDKKEDSPGNWLLTEPELERREPGRALVTLRAAARSWSGGTDEVLGEKLGQLLAASWMEQTIVEAPLETLGVGNKLSVRHLATALDWLPPSFRSGWMTGCDERLAEILGAPLLLREGKSDSDSDGFGQELAAKGQKLFEAWMRAAEFSPALGGRNLIPISLWENTGMGDASAGIAAASWLSMLQQPQMETALATALRASPQRLAALPADARQEVGDSLVRVLLASAKPEQMNEHLTSLLLDAVCAQHAAACPQVQVRPGLLQAARVKDYLNERGFSPAALPSGALDEDLMQELWEQAVLKASNSETAQAVLQTFLQTSATPARAEKLVWAALKRWAPQGALHPWRKALFGSTPGLHGILRDEMASLALKRLKDDLPDSALDYLVLGNDAGAAGLREFPESRQKRAFNMVMRLATDLCETTHYRPPYSDPQVRQAAKDWLAGLQASAFRESLSIDLCRKIAVLGGWTYFLHLDALLMGGAVAPLPTTPPREEKKWLAQEAPALAAWRSAGAPPPKLAALEDIIGTDALEETALAVANTHPDLSGETGNLWIGSLWSRHLGELARVEQMRRLLEEPRTDLVRDYWFACPRALMPYCLDQLLTAPSGPQEEAIGRALAVVVAQVESSEARVKGCRATLETLCRSDNSRAAFVTRLWPAETEAFWSWVCLAKEASQIQLVREWAALYPNELKSLLRQENEHRKTYPSETILYAPLWRFLRNHEDGLTAADKLSPAARKAPRGWTESRPAYRPVPEYLDEEESSKDDHGTTARPGRPRRILGWIRRIIKWLFEQDLRDGH